jgi:hypothetical protein
LLRLLDCTDLFRVDESLRSELGEIPRGEA